MSLTCCLNWLLAHWDSHSRLKITDWILFSLTSPSHSRLIITSIECSLTSKFHLKGYTNGSEVSISSWHWVFLQAGSLSDFYEVCKGLELARNFQFPVLREVMRLIRLFSVSDGFLTFFSRIMSNGFQSDFVFSSLHNPSSTPWKNI